MVVLMVTKKLSFDGTLTFASKVNLDDGIVVRCHSLSGYSWTSGACWFASAWGWATSASSLSSFAYLT